MPLPSPHNLVALAIALGVALAPRAASAEECACSSGSAVPSIAVPSTECESRDEIRCETVEDCATILPFSLDIRRTDLARGAGATTAPLARLAWCERADDPRCSEAPDPRSGGGHVVPVTAALAAEVFVVPPRGEATSRSTTHTAIAVSLEGRAPDMRLDRPPR